MSDEGKKGGDSSEDAERQDEQSDQTAPAVDPKEAFVQGMGLLWHAARGAWGGLKKEIERADIPSGMKSVADEMKRAADAAIRGKPREPEPEWVQREKQGARIQTDDEPSAPVGEQDEPPPAEPSDPEGGDKPPPDGE